MNNQEYILEFFDHINEQSPSNEWEEKLLNKLANSKINQSKDGLFTFKNIALSIALINITLLLYITVKFNTSSNSDYREIAVNYLIQTSSAKY